MYSCDLLPSLPGAWHTGAWVLLNLTSVLITSLRPTRAQPSSAQAATAVGIYKIMNPAIQHISSQGGEYKSNMISTICTASQPASQSGPGHWTLLSREFKSSDDKRFYELKV